MFPGTPLPLRLATLAVAFAGAAAPRPLASAPIHTTYLWHMHQPIYWPERSLWNGLGYELAFETIQSGHSASDEFAIFNSDDRVHDYQDYPKLALQSVLGLPDAGAQVSFAGSLIQNVKSLAEGGWNGGRYAPAWSQPYRDAMGWTTSGGRRRLEPVLVGSHHAIHPLVDEQVFRRMLETQRALHMVAWGAEPVSAGFFPAEMCFSERLIPALVEHGVQWSVIPDIHLARACADYPYAAHLDNCDPPNRADQSNPAAGGYVSQSISRGVTTRVPAPFGFRPHWAQHVDPASGAISRLIVVPAANAMSWNEGYSLYGTGEIDAIAAANDPARPMLILFAHDGDNAWSGGHTYYTQNVAQFCAAAAAKGYEPTTVAEYLADHPPDPADLVHVEDGGWVNADGDFGSPQFINWNWPLVNASGGFDVPDGWAEDERNWAVLTAAVNVVVTAEQMSGQSPAASRIADPTLPGATPLERAWHFLLAGHESGYMYYGTALDFEVKPTLAANRAIESATPLLAGADQTAPTIWLPQRLPWNPGGTGGGALWGYPGGTGAAMSRDFHVWTFVHDVSGVDTVTLRFRLDGDGTNPPDSIENETYAGGAGVGAWQTLPMARRAFPAGNVYGNPEIQFSVLPAAIAEEFWVEVTGLEDQLVDYYVEARDAVGNVRRSPIQHVWVGAGSAAADPAVSWTPHSPAAGQTLTITYDAAPGALADDANPVYLHLGHSGWTGILTPDPAMTRDGATTRWSYAYAIPPEATSVDFVFRDGAGHWDNHGGADWHVPVSGATPPPHVIDGTLDPGLSPIASCAGLDLHADYDGRWLYLAAPAVGATAGLDHFVLVAGAEGPLRAAPWAKADSTAGYDLLLGNEDSNNWCGWFGPAGGAVPSGVQQAAGAVLEALVDVPAVLGAAPPSLRLAFAGYASPDGGALARQIPCGDGDGRLASAEWLTVWSHGALAVPPAAPAARRFVTLRSGNPTRGRVTLALDVPAGEPVRLELLDVRGRRIASLHDGPLPAGGAIPLDLARSGVPPGLYFVVARAAARRDAVRIALLR